MATIKNVTLVNLRDAAYAGASANVTAAKMYKDCRDSGADEAQADEAFRIGWMAGAFAKAVVSKLTKDELFKLAEEMRHAANAGAQKPNAHGQRSADWDNAYKAAKVALGAAKTATGYKVKAERAPQASTENQEVVNHAAPITMPNVVVPHTVNANEVAMAMETVTKFLTKFVNQNAKAIGTVPGLETIIRDFASDVVTVCEPYAKN
jgi:hypothetical protein